MENKNKVKLLLISSFLLLGSINVNAQEPKELKHQIKIGVGSGNILDLLHSINSFTNTLFLSTSPKSSNEKYTPTITLSYGYNVSKKLMVSADLAYVGYSEDLSSSSTLLGKSESAFLTFGIMATYNYINNPKFMLYSGAGAGYVVSNEKWKPVDTSTSTPKESSNFEGMGPYFHVNFIGAQYGKKLAVFGELGLGYKGVVSGGLNYKF